MKKIILTIAVCIFAVPLHSSSDYLKVTLVSPQISYDENDDIIVYCVVENTFQFPVEFSVYDVPYTTFQPVIYTAMGQEAPLTVEYRLKNQTTSEAVKEEQPRRITLRPNEKFVYKAVCNNFYTLSKNETYRIRVYFYPDALNEYAIKSVNELSIKVLPAPEFAMRTGIVEHKRAITPSEVVMLALIAEKSKTWDNVVKYLNIEKYIYAYPEFARRFSTTSDYDRLIVQQEFINFITKERPDYLIDFSVIGEQMQPGAHIAYVDAKVRRWGPRFPAVMRYRYTLERFKDFWLIVNLDASIIKE